MAQRVAVIGAGIVGVAVAIEALRDGHQVILCDSGEPGGRQAASFGNGAWISPASVVPMSMPGLWRKVPGYLLDPLGPLTIRWSALPSLAGWLGRFLWAGATKARVTATAEALAALLLDAPDRHLTLAHETGQPDRIRQDGLLYAYPDRAGFAAEALAWHLRRHTGLVWHELDEAALRHEEPALSARYRFGVLVPSGAHCTDPGAYVASLAAHAVAGGAKLMRGTVTGFDLLSGRLQGIRLGAERIACDRAVIAAGIGSADLAKQAGDRIPLASERGYHAAWRAPTLQLRRPVMPSDGKMGNTHTAGALRASGQVELAGVVAAPDWRRAQILFDHVRRSYAGVPETVPADQIDHWLGHRPSTPDGLPVIGTASGSSDILHAFGHGHIGLAAGPITGRLVADLLSARAPIRPLAPYAPQRFR